MSVPPMETHSLSAIAAQMSEDISALRGTDEISLAMRDMIDSPAPAAMIRQLDRFDVTEMDVSSTEYSNPSNRIQDYMMSGAQTMDKLGIPSPHLEDYYAAQSIASLTGRPASEIMEEFDAVRPLEVGVPGTAADLQSISTFSETDSVQAAENLQTSEIPGVTAQNYAEYDVHFMMYPLGHDIAGTGLETRPSHGFIVVTEKGVDPLTLDENPEEVLLVTRGGPDAGYLDGRFDTNIQSPTENNRDGDVYIKDHAGSEEDLEQNGIRLIETSTIHGDIESIRENVEYFRQAVNSTDINYHAPWQNSNTYAGDVYENLTGKEAPDTIQWPHYMPGLGNDLPVEGDHSYDAGL